MTVLAVANQKGGVGKTTTSINVAATLAERGQRVLLLADLDPQSSATLSLGIDLLEVGRTACDSVVDRSDHEAAPLEEAIMRLGAPPDFDLVPSTLDLAAAEVDLMVQMDRERALRNALAPVRARFEFVVIDCPPSLGLLTINALTAADAVTVPVQTDYLSVRGASLLITRTLDGVQRKLNPELRLLGVLATMHDRRTGHAREVLAGLEETFGGVLFETVIKHTVRFRDAAAEGHSILEHARSTDVADGYRRLTAQVLPRVEATHVAA